MRTAPFSNATTSLAAANAILPTMQAKARMVYELLRRPEHMHRGLTADEILQRIQILQNTLTARIRGLYLDGWIFATGATRPTRNGRMANVWFARERAVPPAEAMARKPQTAGRIAAAVQAERLRCVMEFQRVADEIMDVANAFPVGLPSAIVEGATAYQIARVRADSIRKAATHVHEKLLSRDRESMVGRG